MERGTEGIKNSSQNYIAIESFGVRLRVHAGRTELLKEINERISGIIPDGLYKKIAPRRAVHSFSVRRNSLAEYVLFKGRQKITFGDDKENFLKFLDWQIRMTIAEFAVSRVFVHAGVVEWEGKAIILPAKSFGGKTTLVKELTKLGAKYYSDEYAVLDEDGFVHPFPKMISIRGLIDKYRQIDYPIETFGGIKGVVPVPVGMVLLTEFESGAEWHAQVLSEGMGMIELLSHTIPIRYNPKFSLKVLNKIVNRAIIVKTKRGEAEEFAVKVLSFFESKAF